MRGPIGMASALAVMVMLAVIQAEAVGRIERTPLLLLRLAARKLPRSMRDAQLEEWSANFLDEIYADIPGMPLTRLVRGMRFATSAWWGARRLARELDPSTPRNIITAYVQASVRWGVVAGGWSVRKRHPRLLSHVIAIYVMRHWIDVVLFGLISPLLIGGTTFLGTIGTMLAIIVAQSLVTAVCRGAGMTLVEKGRHEGWSARRIYCSFQVCVDLAVPSSSMVWVLLVFNGFSWWLPPIWLAGFAMASIFTWLATRRPERMVVDHSLLPAPLTS